MLEMIDATNTIESVDTDFTPETVEAHNELGEAITNLWVAHANAKIAARATKEELGHIRAKLGEQLSEMKQILAKPRHPSRHGRQAGRSPLAIPQSG
jgi:hypothetical protein